MYYLHDTNAWYKTENDNKPSRPEVQCVWAKFGYPFFENLSLKIKSIVKRKLANMK